MRLVDRIATPIVGRVSGVVLFAAIYFLLPPIEYTISNVESKNGFTEELKALRQSVEEAARHGENVDNIRIKLSALEKALTGKSYEKKSPTFKDDGFDDIAKANEKRWEIPTTLPKTTQLVTWPPKYGDWFIDGRGNYCFYLYSTSGEGILAHNYRCFFAPDSNYPVVLLDAAMKEEIYRHNLRIKTKSIKKEK